MNEGEGNLAVPMAARPGGNRMMQILSAFICTFLGRIPLGL